MATPPTIQQLYQQLLRDWKNQPRNLKNVEELVDELKLRFIDADHFLPVTQEEQTSTGNKLIMHRDVLEIAVQLAVAKEDIAAFERAMAQLKHYYNDVKLQPTSPQHFEMLGLNLMFLLSQNKLAEFHTELELLPKAELDKNPYTKLPVNLEQYLMEGTYNKIFLLRGNVPSPSYTYFMNILLETVRDEIASCVEKAYEDLSIADTARLLFFTDKATATKLVSEYAKKKDWAISPDKKSFVFANKHANADEHLLQADKLAQNNIFYAKQLEMIV